MSARLVLLALALTGVRGCASTSTFVHDVRYRTDGAGLVVEMPKIAPHMHSKPLDVVVGDAFEVMPQLAADVALVDIFPGYGCNSFDRERLRSKCPRIDFFWAWGAA